MARPLAITALFLLFLSACAAPDSTQPEAETPAAAENEVILGDGVSGVDTTPIGMLLDQADEYIGETVRVTGEVTEVCQQMGCWMEIRDEEKRAIRLKVEDGVIVFPSWAPGHQVRAEGKLERLDMDKDAYLAFREHEAEERGIEFDPESIGEAPYQVVRIQGTGAVIRKDETAGD